MTVRPAGFDEALLVAMRRLKLQARGLTNSAAAAEDLVSETVLKALEKHEHFTHGTSLSAWLYTIMRNAHYSRFRKMQREVLDPDGIFAGKVEVDENQTWTADLNKIMRFSRLLPPQIRSAFNAIVIDQVSYDEAAMELGVPIGTIKSRVNRAKDFLDRFGVTVVTETEEQPVIEEVQRVDNADKIIELYKQGKSIAEIKEVIPEASRMQIMEVVAGVSRRAR